MNARAIISLALLTTLCVGAGLLLILRMTQPPANRTAARGVSATNPLKGHPDAVDRLDMFSAADKFAEGTLEHAVVVAEDSPARIVLNDQRRGTYPRWGRWISPEVQTEFPFTELIPSFNADCPPNTGVRIDVRTRDARSGEWTPWLYIGQWGRILGKGERVVTCRAGTVHVDNLVLDRAADAYQIRATLQSFELDETVKPGIRRIAVSYRGIVSDPLAREQLLSPVKIAGNWQRDLKVPFIAQGVAPANVRGSICSPACVTMVMSYWGVQRPLLENALAIYDSENGIFGNWGRAVQRAGELGLDAWITRFQNWDQVRAMIAQGQPVIAAINFSDGEFPSALLDETNGHLIVIRGFTSEGDVIVNDPASREKGNGAIYKASELGTAWFTNAGGVAYIIRAPGGVSASERTAGLSPTTMPQ